MTKEAKEKDYTHIYICGETHEMLKNDVSLLRKKFNRLKVSNSSFFRAAYEMGRENALKHFGVEAGS